jgi:hypothetical protein
MNQRIKDIEAILRERQRGVVRDEGSEEERPMTERETLMRKIDLARGKERMEDEQNARFAAEEAEFELQEALEAEEVASDEMEFEKESNLMDQDTIYESFTELDEAEGGYSDLVDETGRIPQALIDAIDCKIAEGEYAANDYRIYSSVGEQFRERAKALEENPDLKANYEREDATNRILAKQSRERLLDQQYFEAAQDKGPEPVTLEDQEERFVQNFNDVAGDPHQMADAKANVDQQHRESFIEGGFPDNSPGVYDRAGEIARLRQAMAELKKGRSQAD